jgi:hypothetical protein
VSPEKFGAGYATANERLTTGVQGLDDMIETGWLRGTSTLVIGPSGSARHCWDCTSCAKASGAGSPACW